MRGECRSLHSQLEEKCDPREEKYTQPNLCLPQLYRNIEHSNTLLRNRWDVDKGWWNWQSHFQRDQSPYSLGSNLLALGEVVGTTVPPPLKRVCVGLHFPPRITFYRSHRCHVSQALEITGVCCLPTCSPRVEGTSRNVCAPGLSFPRVGITALALMSMTDPRQFPCLLANHSPSHVKLQTGSCTWKYKIHLELKDLI